MADRGESPNFRIVGAAGNFDAEGTPRVETLIGASNEPMHPEEARFAFAEATGLPPEAFSFPGEVGHSEIAGDTPARRAGRTSVGFVGGWNSSWVPEVDKGKDDGPTLL